MHLAVCDVRHAGHRSRELERFVRDPIEREPPAAVRGRLTRQVAGRLNVERFEWRGAERDRGAGRRPSGIGEYGAGNRAGAVRQRPPGIDPTELRSGVRDDGERDNGSDAARR
jgi:hypothetical protein